MCQASSNRFVLIVCMALECKPTLKTDTRKMGRTNIAMFNMIRYHLETTMQDFWCVVSW